MRFAFFGVASGFDESRLGVAFGQAIDQPLFFAARPKIKDFVSLDELCSLISLSIEILQDSDRIIYTHYANSSFNEGLTVIEAKTRFSTFLMLDKSPTVASNSMNCVQTFLASLAGRVSADKTLSNKTRVLLSSFKWIRKSR